MRDTKRMQGISVLILCVLIGCAEHTTVRAGFDDEMVHKRDVPTIEYTVSLPAPQTQMVNIAIEVRDVKPNESKIDFVLPTWRPGKYVILDPAGTVRGAEAINPATGEPLPVRKVDKTTWRVETDGASAVRFAYRIYANSLGDRTRHVDDSHAFLSGSSVFVFNPKRRDEPLRIELDMPSRWEVATGLEFADGSDDRALVAPNYDVLVDSPIELGEHERIEFEVKGKDYEIVIWPPDLEYDADQLVEDFTKIIASCVDLFGPMPHDRYLFLMHVGAGAGGGTEHLNSTVMQTGRSRLEGSIDNNGTYKRFLGLVAHEFIHTWNVKGFRPAGLSPYDYVDENYTTLLWVAEGTTSYYDELLRVRTGHIKPDDYLDDLADSIEYYRRKPGSRVQSLAESSFDAWVKFNRHSPDDVNAEVSIYRKGALASALIDLEMRKRTNNAATMDDVMREMAERFRWRGPGYTPEDFRNVIEAKAGGSFDSFFERYIDGTETLAFEEVFEVVGLELYFDASDDAVYDIGTIDEAPLEPYLGLDLRGSGGGFSRVRAVRSDGPAYTAGIIVGDEILAMDNRRLGAGALDDRLEHYEVGDIVTFTIMRHDELHEIDVRIAGKPDGSWKIQKVDVPTDARKAAYESWLGQAWEE